MIKLSLTRFSPERVTSQRSLNRRNEKFDVDAAVGFGFRDETVERPRMAL